MRKSFLPALSVALVGLTTLISQNAFAQGRLLVTSEAANNVLSYDATTGAFLGVFSTGEGKALTLGPDGNVYILLPDHVEKYSQSGTLLSTFVSGLNGEGKAFAFGPDGNLYITNNESRTSVNGDFFEIASIQRFNGTTGAYIDDFITLGTGGLNEAMSLAFGPDGNLYVGNGGDYLAGTPDDDSILRYNATTGAFVDTFVPVNQNGLSDPNGLVFGADGTLYVTNEGTGGTDSSNPHTVQHYKTDGTFLGNFVSSGSGGIVEPFSLVFGPTGDLFVGSGDTAEVYRYDGTTGAYVSTFIPAGGGGLGDPKGLLFLPAAVPEPGALAFGLAAAGGVLGLLVRRRKA